MNVLIWKFIFALHLRKKLGISFAFAWDHAESWIEQFPDCVDDSPVESAEEEVEAWRQSQ